MERSLTRARIRSIQEKFAAETQSDVGLCFRMRVRFAVGREFQQPEFNLPALLKSFRQDLALLSRNYPVLSSATEQEGTSLIRFPFK